MIASSALPRRYRSTSMSTKRSIVVSELLVWTVDNTKCPVILARTAIRAVSLSLISPIIMIFGSCRKMERRALANVKPISDIT